MLGLRFEKAEIDALIQGVRAMIMGIRGIETSSYFQEIFGNGRAEGLAEGRIEGRNEGRIEEAKAILLRQGRARWGEPDAPIAQQIEALNDLDAIESRLDRILTAADWHDLIPKA